METLTGVAAWSTAAWRAEAVRWLDERLAAASIVRTGEVEQRHLRPWATVLRAPTTAGAVWLKAAAPATAFEVGLYEVLAEVAPDAILEPIATDRERGWIVLPDGGVPLGERLAGGALVDAMAPALARYAELQRAVAPHADRLLDLGVADMRPAALPERFEQALAVAGDHAMRRGDDADRATCRRVAALRGTVEAWCHRLAALPGGVSVDHNDLHVWNVVEADGRTRFYDWGDAVVAHPFASMLVALGYVRSRVLRSSDDDPRLLRLRDAYLEPFSDLAPHAVLVETLELACRAAKIARALVWERAVRALGPDDVDDEWASAPLRTLASLLDDSYLGGA